MVARYGAPIQALDPFLNSVVNTSARAKTTVDAFRYTIKNFVAGKADKVGPSRNELHEAVMDAVSLTAAAGNISVLGGKGECRPMCADTFTGPWS